MGVHSFFNSACVEQKMPPEGIVQYHLVPPPCGKAHPYKDTILLPLLKEISLRTFDRLLNISFIYIT